MPTKKSPNLARLSVAVACAAFLTACGGGSDGNGGKPPQEEAQNPQPSTELTADAQKSGLESVPSTPGTQTYNLTLSVGDTWQLALSPSDKKYTLTVLQGAFDAATDSRYSGSYDDSTPGLITGTDSSSQQSFQFQVDAGTGSITGTLNMQTASGQPLVAAATGTSYATPTDLGRLKGSYFFMMASRNAGNGSSPERIGGQARIGDDGKQLLVCAQGLFDQAGNCTSPDSHAKQELHTFALARDARTGLVKVSDDKGPQGWLNFQVTDLGGYSIFFDRLGYNTDTPPVNRTGTAYLTRTPLLTAGALDGNWHCTDAFNPSWHSDVTIRGLSLNWVDASAQTGTEQLYLNQVTNDAGKLLDLPGVITTVVQGGTLQNDAAIIQPVSTALFTVEREAANSLGMCQRKKS